MASANLSNLELFIYFGTADMYTCQAGEKITLDSKTIPRNVYGFRKSIGKNLLETLFKTQNFPGICLVPSVIYGPGQQKDMFLPALINNLLNNQEFKMTEGLQFRDYIFVTDVVDAVIGLLNRRGDKCLGLSLLLGSGYAITIKDLALTVASCLSRYHRDLLHFGALSSRKSGQHGYRFDMSKSEILLEWKAQISLEFGIEKTLTQARKLKNK